MGCPRCPRGAEQRRGPACPDIRGREHHIGPIRNRGLREPRSQRLRLFLATRGQGDIDVADLAVRSKINRPQRAGGSQMKSRWIAMSTFLLGLALGPPMLAVFDGCVASLHATKRGSGQRLIRNYDDAGPPQPLVLWGYPNSLNEPPKGCTSASAHWSDVVLHPDDLDHLQQLNNAWAAVYDRELTRARARSLERLTGVSQRTFLADCLPFPVYSAACHPFAQEVISRADVQSREQRQLLSKQLLADFGPLRCMIWEKAAARRVS